VQQVNAWYGPIKMHLHANGELEPEHTAGKHDDDDGDNDGGGSSTNSCRPSSLPDYKCALEIEAAALELHWTWDESKGDRVMVHFATVAETTGYVALGFRPDTHARMNPADAIIGWIDAETAEAHIGGYHLQGYSLSDVKASDEIFAMFLNTSIEESGGHTTLKFSRELSTAQFSVLPQGLYRVPAATFLISHRLLGFPFSTPTCLIPLSLSARTSRS